MGLEPCDAKLITDKSADSFKYDMVIRVLKPMDLCVILTLHVDKRAVVILNLWPNFGAQVQISIDQR